MNTIEQYTQLVLAIKKFKEQNAEIFSKLELLEEGEKQLGELLKQEIIASGKDEENAFFKVSYVERWKKEYNWDNLTTKEKAKLKEIGAARFIIDSKLFEEAVKSGDISREAKQRAFSEQLQTKMAVIKEKKYDKQE